MIARALGVHWFEEDLGTMLKLMGSAFKFRFDGDTGCKPAAMKRRTSCRGLGSRIAYLFNSQ